MLSLETWLAFASATALFAYMPGPSLLYAAAQTMAHGRSGGLRAALGLHLGCYVHVLAVALGFSALLVAVPTAYAAMKLVGAGYLVWLGLQLVRDAIAGVRPGPAGDPAATEHALPQHARRPLLSSAIVEILNPKTALFYYAFLPQFVDPASGVAPWLQFLVLGTLVNLAFSSADLIAVVFADWVSGTLARSARAAAWVRGLGGTILVALGLRLAMDRN
ncbi:MAG: LysE family translocator [Rhizobiales bacterium]|nr:LysE family translocator [Hyphomicrobiales bacterium]